MARSSSNSITNAIRSSMKSKRPGTMRTGGSTITKKPMTATRHAKPTTGTIKKKSTTAVAAKPKTTTMRGTAKKTAASSTTSRKATPFQHAFAVGDRVAFEYKGENTRGEVTALIDWNWDHRVKVKTTDGDTIRIAESKLKSVPAKGSVKTSASTTRKTATSGEKATKTINGGKKVIAKRR